MPDERSRQPRRTPGVDIDRRTRPSRGVRRDVPGSPPATGDRDSTASAACRRWGPPAGRPHGSSDRTVHSRVASSNPIRCNPGTEGVQSTQVQPSRDVEIAQYFRLPRETIGPRALGLQLLRRARSNSRRFRRRGGHPGAGSNATFRRPRGAVHRTPVLSAGGPDTACGNPRRRPGRRTVPLLRVQRPPGAIDSPVTLPWMAALGGWLNAVVGVQAPYALPTPVSGHESDRFRRAATDCPACWSSRARRRVRTSPRRRGYRRRPAACVP